MDPELTEMKRQYLAQAEAAFDQMLLENQENLQTFDQIEQRAVELSRKFGLGLLERHIQRRARATTGAVGCPRCRREAQRTNRPPELRTVETRTGPVRFERCQYRCAQCRIRFFPRRRESEVGRGRV